MHEKMKHKAVKDCTPPDQKNLLCSWEAERSQSAGPKPLSEIIAPSVWESHYSNKSTEEERETWTHGQMFFLGFLLGSWKYFSQRESFVITDYPFMCQRFRLSQITQKHLCSCQASENHVCDFFKLLNVQLYGEQKATTVLGFINTRGFMGWSPLLQIKTEFMRVFTCKDVGCETISWPWNTTKR